MNTESGARGFGLRHIILQAISFSCWTTPVLANGRIYARSTKETASFDVSGK